jgi:all-trans-retinol 13,14-reductase
MAKYDVIIIGSGLGGLECGYILSKKGYNVCILEKNGQVGGCLQCFRRGNREFDTGFHAVGGLQKGQSLYPFFRYFDLLDLPWRQLDETRFAEVVLNEKSYSFACGHARFADTLANRFPHQRKQLEHYTAFLKSMSNTIDAALSVKAGAMFPKASLFERSAYQFLQQNIDDPLLRNVLSGACLTLELCAEKTPLYIFAQINNSFIQSAWRLEGGGSLIAERLVQRIRSMGGTVLTNARANQLTEVNGTITQVRYNETQQVEGTYIISDIHPQLTLSLLPESPSIRKIYRTRLGALQNSCGMFTTHLQLKENQLPYINWNSFVYKKQNLWDCAYRADSKTTAVLISYPPPEAGAAYATTIDILTPMYWQEVSPWADTSVGQRGTAYAEFKLRKAEECIGLASEQIAGLKPAIETVYTSTPLTYRDYTGTWEGSAYGIQKDYANLLYTMLSPQTPVANLLLTGQNLNLHGILGVSISSFFTCAKITGMDTLLHDLHEENDLAG